MAKLTEKQLAVIDELLYNRIENGDSCIETAEFYQQKVKKIDPELHAALVQLNEGAERMINRLTELNDEYNLGYEDI